MAGLQEAVPQKKLWKMKNISLAEHREALGLRHKIVLAAKRHR
jgi:hypothetical protein